MSIPIRGIVLVVIVSAVQTLHCGQTPHQPNLTQRGTVVPFSWPWHAALYAETDNGTFFSCGGSVVASRWILTAAHCLDYNPIAFVRLGVFDRKVEYDDEQQIRIKKAIIHPNYARKGVSPDDIALLELEEETVYTDEIQPVCLTKEDQQATRSGESLWRIGWGYLSIRDANPPDKLHQTNPMVDMNCYWKKLNHKAFICAGNNTDGACHHDSGGALVQKSAVGSWYGFGIVSHSTSGFCGAAAYTRISTYCDWMKNVTDGDVACDYLEATSKETLKEVPKNRYANKDTEKVPILMKAMKWVQCNLWEHCYTSNMRQFSYPRVIYISRSIRSFPLLYVYIAGVVIVALVVCGLLLYFFACRHKRHEDEESVKTETEEEPSEVVVVDAKPLNRMSSTSLPSPQNTGLEQMPR